MELFIACMSSLKWRHQEWSYPGSSRPLAQGSGPASAVRVRMNNVRVVRLASIDFAMVN